ncbi:MAG: Spx/MgsR family RNA polymerase-binding regulatory protein [Corallincola sp.]|nr:Spx/MgsR family RNA polymerase-binding regulatory protein [Corallincola sp.]
MTITLYGIANCDKVRAARRFLDQQQAPHLFIDLRQQPAPQELLQRALLQLGSKAVINKSSTTFRQLSADEQRQADDPAQQLALLQRYPTLIKRPLLVAGDTLMTGFDADHYQRLLAEMA